MLHAITVYTLILVMGMLHTAFLLLTKLFFAWCLYLLLMCHISDMLLLGVAPQEVTWFCYTGWVVVACQVLPQAATNTVMFAC